MNSPLALSTTAADMIVAAHTKDISKRRAAGQNLGGRPQRVTDSQIRSATRLVQAGDPVTQVARDLGMSRATFYRRSQALNI